MSLDPREDVARAASGDPIERLTRRVADLERRLEAARNQPTALVFVGTPGVVAAAGAIGVQTDVPRLWVSLGGGVWRYAALS